MTSHYAQDPHPAPAIDVHIQYGNRHFRRAKGRRLSEQGMYLEVDHLTLPAGTLVVLEVRDIERRWHIPAIVVHQDGSGIGVMFQENRPCNLPSATLPLLTSTCAPALGA
ncbi:PilZ domain-containing protein [Caldichromatium japonicum]|uniref:PilZ domain-containing protein n=1 Tax=Caldichromatium japonicum TaxID=2699430 RepID=UPI001B356EF2|nr:PilZ domain-containing protein [Caldichromatium japonicum]